MESQQTHKQNDSATAQGRDQGQDRQNDRSMGSLLRELMLELMSLVRNEAALVRTEISDNVAQLQAGVVSLVLAGVLLLVGLIGLMFAGIYGLANVWPMWLSALVIGGGIVVVGLIALAFGRSRMKASNLTLDRSAKEFRRDAKFAQEQTR